MRRIALLIAVLVLLLPACKSNEAGESVPDWPAIVKELELGAADARDAASLFEDPGVRDGLTQLAVLLGAAAIALQGGAEPASVLDVLDRALVLADALVGELPEESQADARAGLLVVRAALRRARAYAGAEQ